MAPRSRCSTRATPTSPRTACASAAPTRASCGPPSPGAASVRRPRRRTRRPSDDSVDFGGTDNPDPVPSFESPLRTDESAVTFKPVDEDGEPLKGELFVGEYEANVTPVADTDGGTPRGATVELLPGEYSFVARADGRGAQKFTRTIAAGKLVDLTVTMPANRASGAERRDDHGRGRQPRAPDRRHRGDQLGRRRARARRRGRPRSPCSSPAASRLVDRVQASALLRAADDTDDQADPGAQNRFTALRQFEILTCSGTCADDGDFDSIFTEPRRRVPRRSAAAAGAGHDPARLRRAGHRRRRTCACGCSPTSARAARSTRRPTASWRTTRRPSSDCTAGQRGDAAPRPGRPRRRAAGVLAPGRGRDDGAAPPGRWRGDPGRRHAPRRPAGHAARGAAPGGLREHRGLPLRRGAAARPRAADRVRPPRRRPVNVDVFQQSRGRRVIDNLLVARFTAQTRVFTWNGRRATPSG